MLSSAPQALFKSITLRDIWVLVCYLIVLKGGKELLSLRLVYSTQQQGFSE